MPPGADWGKRRARRQRPRCAGEAYTDTQRPSTQAHRAGSGTLNVNGLRSSWLPARTASRQSLFLLAGFAI